MSEIEKYDFALIGGGIMSATLGVLLKKLDPSISIVMYERLGEVAEESSNPWNNAGTGHAALCELNYMLDSTDGSLPGPAKAVAINEQFQASRQFWSSLVTLGALEDPKTFIRSVPHITFVRGDSDVDYLRRRQKSLDAQPLFTGMKFSEDAKELAEWIPLMMDGRGDEKVAATFTNQGTDVDYGSMTKQMINWLVKNGMRLETNTEVKSVLQFEDKKWQLWFGGSPGRIVHANKVFVGAGGYALKILQKSGIPEIDGYGTFPVSGHFLRTDDPEIVASHQAKVYSQAEVGAPPMSVPHLDTRVVDGKTSLLFGPFAGVNPKFLKNGSVLDLPLSIRIKNITSYLSVALRNLDLMKYLLTEVTKSKKSKFEALRVFVPKASPKNWSYYEAGQRAQVIKPNGRGGTLQFGTEVISSKDGTIAGLLGASPGASVSVSVMLDVLERMAPDEFPTWAKAIKELIPSFGKDLNKNAELAKKTMKQTAKSLKLSA